MTSSALHTRLPSTILLGCLLLVSSACGPKERPQTASEKSLQALAVFYGQFTGKNKGVGPANEEEFKKYIRGLPPAQLQTFGLEASGIDALFTSPRDNQPYGIAWKARGVMPGPNGAPMVIWEQTGVNGKRFVADAVGKIEEVDESAWNERMEKTKKAK